MATEAAVDRPVDAPASEVQPAPDAHHVDLDRPTVNGNASIDDIENKLITSVEDQIISAEPSISGGSDTEASRADGTKSKDGDKGHGRTASSVKKPATFKAVSVNKTFLASKANTSSSTTKATDKPPAGASTPPTGSATLSVSRPRLVAKAGTGGQNSLPRLSAANGGKPPSAPDPSVVWNKNRPVPPPEPKKFTDEELKKYGIHMASRLEEEDTGGQNKWADIDDDDDDWAPEAITWGDGTKTTLPHNEEPPAPASDNGSVAPQGTSQGNPQVNSQGHPQGHPQGKSFSLGIEKPRSPAPPTSVGSPLAKSTGLASGKGLVLKSGSQDKPGLVARPPPLPTPARSPWASLPPVEKASPIISEPAHLARGPGREHMPPKGMTPPPKEIAADDFSRSSWRDGASHGNRELYNPHPVRNEAISERRSSMRMDQHPRPHALLQRPSQSDHPEPSGAFQTNRVSQEVPFGRRRGSSNVSGGSGMYFQHGGKGNQGMPPPEHLGPRRPSFAGSTDSPLSPINHSGFNRGPHGHQPQPGWAPRASPGAVFATPHEAALPQEGSTGASPPVQPAQPVELAQSVQSPQPAQPAQLVQPAQPIQAHEPLVDEVEYQKRLMRERNDLARKRRQEEEIREDAAKKERIQKKLEALGPAPEKKSDKKESLHKDDVSRPTHIQQRESSASSTHVADQPQQETVQAETLNNKEHVSEPATNPMSPGKPPPTGPGARRSSQSQEPKADLWGNANNSSRQESRFVASWGAAAPPIARNVWGSPNNDRGLGNGTFNTDLGRLADGTTPAPGLKGPAAPIAPPGASRTPSQGRPQPPAPIGSRSARYGPATTDVANKWVAGVADNDKKLSAAKLVERTERERKLAEQGMTIEDAQPIIKDTWRQVHVPGDGTRRAAAPIDPQGRQPGAWKALGEDAVRTSPSAEDGLPSANTVNLGPSGSGMLSQAGKAASAQGRTSRFFPSRDIRTEHATSGDASRSMSPTPPPPTMEGHPAYEGDVMRPHVSLPKPQPVVKLPPTMTAAQASQAAQARPQQFGWAHTAPYKDASRGSSGPHHGPFKAGEASQEKWQSRINSLLNGVKSPPPPQKSNVVEPASKSALDHVSYPQPATVSLPTFPPTRPYTTQKSSISKPMAEECFEEQEMGSLPQINIPPMAPEAAWQPAEAPIKPLPKRFSVQATIMEPYYFAAEVVGGGNAMRIQFPGMAEPRIVTVPFSASRGSRGSQGRPGPRHRGSTQERRGGKRDVSNPRGERGEHVSSPSGRGSRGSRGGYHSRGSENWSRQPATPPSLPV
ncbi:hypothetical protein G7046_g1354 [Stylonectria norvegica]|nr:hypothetical protein G7046_g1354 [Stylonectria norvegica]